MPRALGWVFAAGVASVHAADGEFSAVARTVPETHALRGDGPFREAASLTDFGRDRVRGEVEARAKVRAVTFVGTARALAIEGREPRYEGLLNELYADVSPFGQSFSLGKKIAGWGVGFGFRPLDVVQQQDRRQLVQFTLEGIPAVTWEHFDATAAWAVVYANPTAGRAGASRDDESLAARWFRQDGATDWHGVARWSARTRAQVGVGVNHVVDDAMQWYASALLTQRHGRQVNALAGANVALAPANPLEEVQYGTAWQVAAGGTWTGASGFGVLAEVWFDGTAYTPGQWRDVAALARRQAALLGVPGVPDAAVRGNLAWSLRYFERPNVARENVLLRWSYDGDPWDAAFDVLATPRDRGAVLTASLSRQFDRARLEAGVRRYAGPPESAYALLPDRFVAYLAGQLFF